MNWGKVSSHLDKYKNLKKPEDYIKDAVVSIIEECTGIKLEKSVVSVKRDKVYLNLEPLHKSEIFLHKKEILKKLDSVYKVKDLRDLK